MKKRLHIYYSGSVQGVGFRFTAERAASVMGITGWTKNLDDGRVEVVCEGEKADLDAFLQKIASVFKEYIRDVDQETVEATGEFVGFDVRF
ncbi:MAG: acylphosphatase [Candidatus Omnitrophota bacterium]|nr:acylphosphatase [Candidatus Omnitrophota bacterium]